MIASSRRAFLGASPNILQKCFTQETHRCYLRRKWSCFFNWSRKTWLFLKYLKILFKTFSSHICYFPLSCHFLKVSVLVQEAGVLGFEATHGVEGPRSRGQQQRKEATGDTQQQPARPPGPRLFWHQMWWYLTCLHISTYVPFWWQIGHKIVQCGELMTRTKK